MAALAAFCQLILNGNKKYIKSVSLIPELMLGRRRWRCLRLTGASWLPFERVIAYAFYLPSYLCDGIASALLTIQFLCRLSTVATKSELRIQGALKVFALKSRQKSPQIDDIYVTNVQKV